MTEHTRPHVDMSEIDMNALKASVVQKLRDQQLKREESSSTTSLSVTKSVVNPHKTTDTLERESRRKISERIRQ